MIFSELKNYPGKCQYWKHVKCWTIYLLTVYIMLRYLPVGDSVYNVLDVAVCPAVHSVCEADRTTVSFEYFVIAWNWRVNWNYEFKQLLFCNLIFCTKNYPLLTF